MKKLAIFAKENDICADAIKAYFKNSEVDVHSCTPSNINADFFEKNKFDLVAMVENEEIIDESVLKLSKFVNVHPSILPAFSGNNALKDAYLSGVKLSGITIHFMQNDAEKAKIIAQYPVFINNSTRFDEFRDAVKNIECKLYPIVIGALLNDEVFDFQDFMTSSSSSDGGCNGKCEKCHH